MKETIKMSTETIANPKIVSQQEWEAAWQGLLVKEKAFTHSRDALGRRAPAHAVDGWWTGSMSSKVPRVRSACSTCSKAAGS